MDNNPEKNKELEAAASALNEAAVESEADAPKEEKINEETSAAMDALLAEADAPAEKPAEAEKAEPAPEASKEPEAPKAPEAPKDEAPAAPTTAPAPTSAPALAPALAPAAAPAAKKGKKGLLIGVAVGAVALIGGGVGVAYAVTHSPENVALSAISNFLNTKDLAVKGSFEFTPTEGAAGSEVSRIAVNLGSDTDKDNQADASATLTVTYNNKDYSLTVKGVMIKDYTLYVSVENLKQTVDSVLETISDESEYEDYAEIYGDLIDKIVAEVDGVWWRISIPDVIDTVEELSASEKSTYKEVYACFTDATDKAAADDSSAEIYKDNAFIILDKYSGSKSFAGSGTAYNVSISAGKLTSFLNKVSEKTESYGLNDCLKKIDPSFDVKKSTVEQEDVEKALEKLPEDMFVTIKSSFFNSELTGFYLDINEKNYNGKIELTFDHSSKQIAAPSSSKPITDLYKTVENIYTEFEETAQCLTLKSEYPSYYNTYCDPDTNKIRPEYEDYLNF